MLAPFWLSDSWFLLTPMIEPFITMSCWLEITTSSSAQTVTPAGTSNEGTSKFPAMVTSLVGRSGKGLNAVASEADDNKTMTTSKTAIVTQVWRPFSLT